MNWEQFVQRLNKEGFTAEQYERYYAAQVADDILQSTTKDIIQNLLDGSYYITIDSLQDEWTDNSEDTTEKDVQVIIDNMTLFYKGDS